MYENKRGLSKSIARTAKLRTGRAFAVASQAPSKTKTLIARKEYFRSLRVVVFSYTKRGSEWQQGQGI